MKNNTDTLYFSNYDDRPGKLFEMLQHLRASIFIAGRGCKDSYSIYSTKYNRWYSCNRNILFNLTQYEEVSKFATSFVIPKISRSIESDILEHLNAIPQRIESLQGINGNIVYYRAAGGGYFLLTKPTKSITYIDGQLEDVKAEKIISLKESIKAENISALLSSSLFYWSYIAGTDCRNLTKGTITSFPCPPDVCVDSNLLQAAKALFKDYEANSNNVSFDLFCTINRQAA